MGFLHGKSSMVLFGGVNLSGFLNQMSTSNMVETAETTTFGNDAKTYIVGLKDGSMSLSGMFDGALLASDATLSAVIGNSANNVVTFAPSPVFGAVAFSAEAIETSYEVSSPVSDVVAANAEVQADGGIDRCLLLAALSAVTTTSTGTSIDNTASTSSGGVGYLHVTANSRTAGSVFKVQHSADNSTFADLITFTTVATSTTQAEKIEVAGTVNRYVRASFAPGGSTGSITYSLAFARR